MSAVNFDADEMMAKAAAREKLSDYGEEPFREGLEMLCKTLDQNFLSDDVRKGQRRRVLNLLSTRLRFIESVKKNPAMLQREITPPWVITGLPRSGTSALFNLLDTDPAARGFLNWESIFPDPWPDSKPGEKDPRYDFLEEAMAENRKANPEFTKIHYASPGTPEECVLGMALCFEGVHTGYECMLEPYRSWYLQRDLVPMYEFYRDLLRVQDWRNPADRWILKAPAHMWGIPALYQTFPQTQLIWAHRDPLGVVPSICSMNETVMGMYVGETPNIDKHELAHTVMDFYATSLERGLKDREALDSPVVDFGHHELVTDAMGTVRRIYDGFNTPMTTEAEQALQRYIDDNPKGKYGKHEYDLERFGLTEQIIKDRFAFYIEDPRWQPYLNVDA